MANLSSNDLKKVGQKYEVNGEELTFKMLDAVLKTGNCPEWLKRANEEEAKRVAPALWVEEVNFF